MGHRIVEVCNTDQIFFCSKNSRNPRGVYFFSEKGSGLGPCICVIKLKWSLNERRCVRVSGDAPCPPPPPLLLLDVGARPYCATWQKSKPHIKGDALMMSLHLAVIHPLSHSLEPRALNHPLGAAITLPRVRAARALSPTITQERATTDAKRHFSLTCFFSFSAFGAIKFLRFVSSRGAVDRTYIYTPHSDLLHGFQWKISIWISWEQNEL
jgi:hypothetical protein